MKLLSLLFLFSIVSCGSEQSVPQANDSSINDLAIIDNPVELSTFDFKNHQVVYQSLDFLSAVIDEHQPLYLKLSPRDESHETFFLGTIDANTSLNQLRLHLPSQIESVEYHLFNASGFAQSGTINF